MASPMCPEPGTVRPVPARAKYTLAQLDVEPVEPSAWVRIASTDRAIPARFVVQAVLDDPECVVVLEVSLDSSNVPAVDHMHVHRTGEQPDPGPSVTGAVVRRLAVDALLRQAIEQVAEPIEPVQVEGHVGAFRLRRDVEQGHATAYGGRRVRAVIGEGRRTDDETLRTVAKAYRAAGRAPTQAVADELHVSRSHAGRLVAQARDRGFLGATTPGRAGEQA